MRAGFGLNDAHERLAAFAAIALPGADATSSGWWDWPFIAGAVGVGWLLLVAGTCL